MTVGGFFVPREMLMRSDMFKVIVERPRKSKGSGRIANRRRNDFDGPTFLGMRAGLGYRALNENLSPLRRYLHAQIGRPWNKVHAEISAGIDRRNTVQLHVLAHIDEMIAIQVEWHDGELVDVKDRACWRRNDLPTIRQKLYVDPRTGLIRRNEAWKSYSAQRRESDRAARKELARRFRRIDDETRLLLLNGEWFEVRIAQVPKDTPVFDVVLKRLVSTRLVDARVDDSRHVREKLYGEHWLRHRYAKSKRQLSRREIEDYGLPRPTSACGT